MIAQGRKRVFLGDQEFYYDPATYLIASMDLPVTGQVIEAPCLGCTLALDPAKLDGAAAGHAPGGGREQRATTALEVNQLEPDLLDPLLRLLRLLDQPRDIPCWPRSSSAKSSTACCAVRAAKRSGRLARPDSQLSQISRAIEAIRRRYDQPLRIEELARLTHMSATSFHRHFRAVTAMSPLQFQKQIRLQEARRMLRSQNVDAAPRGLRRGLRKRVPVQPRIPPPLRRAAPPRCRAGAPSIKCPGNEEHPGAADQTGTANNGALTLGYVHDTSFGSSGRTTPTRTSSTVHCPGPGQGATFTVQLPLAMPTGHDGMG